MLISYAIENYTNGNRITIWDVLGEVDELVVEILKFSWSGIKEEWRDVGVFFQCWLFWRFKIDGEAWRFTEKSWSKFMNRREVWKEIYGYVGLDENISRFCGNYNRMEKVVKQLNLFGISELRAVEAYDKIVLKK